MNTISMKNKILSIFGPYFLKTGSIDESTVKSIHRVNIKYSSVHYLTHSTFNVAYIDDENVKGYFRESRRHDDLKTYISNIIDDYFRFVSSSEHYEKIKYEINQYLADPNNLHRFYNMGVRNDPKSRIARFYKNPQFSHILGIPDIHSIELDKELKSIMQFIWGELLTYRMSNMCKRGDYQSFNVNRQVATYKIACLLYLDNLIPKTQYVVLSFPDGQEKFGTIMDVACGFSPEHLQESIRKQIGPSLQKEMSDLCLLDLICRHTDHRPGHDGNYNVQYDKLGFACSVSAFDNDAPTSFSLSSKIDFSTSAKTTPFHNKNGEIVYPFLNEKTVDILRKLSRREIKQTVEDCLSYDQSRFVWLRICKIRKLIDNNVHLGKIHLLNDNEWSAETIKSEIENCERKRIVTYLYAYYVLTY